ncbi:glycosyltransferase family 4 protein [Listeria grandensis]|uniref:Glycosyltransferase family 4 protein n=1 Tax=Listeria grandensis TaxID=1494963 RepID=A0A7X0Y500_9LIST|nr:glycosyltransferase family 4 protein [Listeria grandensis]MBC1937126.1 glycosyltransferase family 4 protein [Listeria grandensis]
MKEKKMKLAIICTEDKPVPAFGVGAVEAIVEDLVALNNKKQLVEIDIYSISNEHTETKDHKNKNHYSQQGRSSRFEKLRNQLILRLGVTGLYQCRFLNTAIKEINKRQYDWILVQNRPQFILSLRELLQDKHTKIALHLHNEHFFNKSFKKSLNEFIYCGYDCILTVSDYIRGQVLKSSPGLASSNVRTLRNTIDVEKFKEASSSDLPFFDKLHDRQVVAFHGRLIPEKGVLELIHAYKIARQAIPNLALVIIGELKDTPYCDQLKKAAQGEQEKNIFFTGFIPYSEIELYLGVGDVIVSPSLWNEPCSLAQLESLSMGKPLITTRAGGTSEFVIHEETGFLIDITQNFEEKLAKQIVRCFRDMITTNKVGKNARDFMMKECSRDTYLEKLLETIEG